MKFRTGAAKIAGDTQQIARRATMGIGIVAPLSWAGFESIIVSFPLIVLCEGVLRVMCSASRCQFLLLDRSSTSPDFGQLVAIFQIDL